MPAVEQVVADQSEIVEPGTPRTRRHLEFWGLLSYLALSVVVLIRLWMDPNGRMLSANRDDHGFFLVLLTHGERVLFHGQNPLFNDRFNVPDGVNMMAQTSVMALSLPLAPVTRFLGVGVTVVVLLTLGLAGTAAAWWWVLRQHLVHSRLAAWVGGLWCGFAPAMISHASGHVNFVVQFVVPFIVWQVLRLREPGRAVRGGVILALLIVLQVFINEESLLFTALTLFFFVVAYACFDFAAARQLAGRFAAGLGVAAAVSLALLAYPLWWQFAGPQSYQGQPFEPGDFVTDLLSLGAYARQSLAGNTAIARELTVSATEENTFWGVPMLVMLVVSARMLWHSVAARATLVAGFALLLMSMGPELRVGGSDTGIALPFALIAHVPIIDLVSVTRFAMVPATIVGVLIALACDRAGVLRGRRHVAFWAGMAVAVVPVLPKPLPTYDAPPLPPFMAQRMWERYVPEDRTLVTVPLPEVTSGRTGMRWFALAGQGYRTPRGYFMGPANPPGDKTGSWSAPPRPTADMLRIVEAYGQRPVLTDADRRAAIADLTYWRAAIVVLTPDARNNALLETIVTDLLGKAPQQVGGVAMWDVRDIVHPAG